MSRFQNSLFGIVLIMFLFTVGCDKDDSTNNPGNGGNTPGSNPVITDFGGPTPTNVLALIRTTTTQASFTIDLGVGVANLNNQDKGDVSAMVSGTNYTFGKLTSSSVISYVFPDPQNPTSIINLPANSTNVTFDVTGYALAQNSVTVPGQISLSAPAAGTSVPRSADLTVSWTITGAGSNNAIFITDGSNNIFKQNLGNVTSAVFTAAELSGLNAGNAIVYAISYNFVLTNSNDAVLIGEAVSLNQITLQ